MRWMMTIKRWSFVTAMHQQKKKEDKGLKLGHQKFEWVFKKSISSDVIVNHTKIEFGL